MAILAILLYYILVRVNSPSALKRELLTIFCSALWAWMILVIASYGDLLGWHVWTWIPMTGYIAGSFGLASYFNKARKAVQNFDSKKWLSKDQREALIIKLGGVRERR
jgi:hypothetical protein